MRITRKKVFLAPIADSKVREDEPERILRREEKKIITSIMTA